MVEAEVDRMVAREQRRSWTIEVGRVCGALMYCIHILHAKRFNKRRVGSESLKQLYLLYERAIRKMENEPYIAILQ